MSVAEAQREISSAEFTEWVARESLPGMHNRDDRLFGMLAALIFNVNRDPKRQKALKASDFFAPEEAPDVPTTNEDLMAQAKAWAARMNASRRN
jgi:hypothetical protein